jgi:glycosyltransferase involved in cell wall biosynthesis
MNKPLLVFQGPVATRSGYGDHARDLLQSIFDLDKYDVKIIPTRWGTTPQNQLDMTTEFGQRVLNNVITQLQVQPDIYVQVTVANEFQKLGKYNIGVTAGVETTIAPKEFIDGCNMMDLILVPSTFTKEVLQSTSFTEVDKRTNQKIRDISITKPIEVLFEGVDTDIFAKTTSSKNDKVDVLDGIQTDFNYLFVGHWLSGDLGQDRKDVGMLIKTFCTIFKNTPKDKQPGLILKTSTAGFSVMDRESISAKIKELTDEFGKQCPPIYLLFGDMLPSELSSLYHHPKVKSMISFTKGEGYGRPLAEFSCTGKPIIVSNWSGHIDFLPKEHTILLDGELTAVHPSASNQFLLKESKWFTVNYSNAASKILDVFKNYSKHLEKSKGLSDNTKNKFSLTKMTEEMGKIFSKYVKTTEHITLKLPELKKL